MDHYGESDSDSDRSLVYERAVFEYGPVYEGSRGWPYCNDFQEIGDFSQIEWVRKDQEFDRLRINQHWPGKENLPRDKKTRRYLQKLSVVSLVNVYLDSIMRSIMPVLTEEPPR